MINVSKLVRQAYYNALNGALGVPVYKEDVPLSEDSHYVLIRVESETDRSHSSGFVTNPVVVTEVVGIFQNSIDPDVVDDIDNQLRGVLKPQVTSALSASGIHLTNMKAQDSTCIAEDDGAKKYYRKITRWTQRVSHT